MQFGEIFLIRHPGFLAKYRLLALRPREVTLLPFSRKGPKDRIKLQDPVWLLKIYLKRSAPHRKGR